MRFVTSAGLLIALSCFAFCAAPARATPPVDPPPGSAYLGNKTETMKTPSWLTPSARPPVGKLNLGSATLKRTDPLRVSATPIPIPGPKGPSATPIQLPGPQRVSVTPIPLPGPNKAGAIPARSRLLRSSPR